MNAPALDIDASMCCSGGWVPRQPQAALPALSEGEADGARARWPQASDRHIPLAANGRCWLEFVSDQLTGGRRFRVLTVVDDCTREYLALVADTSLSGLRVARELERIIEDEVGRR